MNIEEAFVHAADAMAPVLTGQPQFNLVYIKSYGGEVLYNRYISAAKVAIETFMKDIDDV